MQSVRSSSIFDEENSLSMPRHRDREDSTAIRFCGGQMVAFFYDLDDEFRNVLTQFLKQGRAAGAKVVLFTDAGCSDDLTGTLQTFKSEAPLPDALPELEILTWGQDGVPQREASPADFRDFWSGRIEKLHGKSLWIGCIPPARWRKAPESEKSLTFHRQEVQNLLQISSTVLLDFYDLRCPDYVPLPEVICSRPQVIHNLRFYDNRYFNPSEDDNLCCGRSLVGCLDQLAARHETQQRLQRQTRRQNLVADLGRDVLRGFELDELMEKTVQAVGACLSAEFSQVLELIPELHCLRPRAWFSREGSEAPEIARIAPGECFEHYVLMEGAHPVLIEDFAETTPLLVPARFGHTPRAASAVGIAIPGRKRPHGVLTVYSLQKKHFDQDDLVFLQSLANLLAVAVAQSHADREIQHLAYFDILTGLPNRTLLADRIEQVISRARRESLEAGVMFLDLDRFKSVNDTLGHASGDELLKVMAGRLAESVRQSDTVARLGGDEFVVILADLDHEEGLAGVARKILDALARPVVLEDHEITTTVSIGIAVFPADGEDSQTLLRHADIAMYQSKERGKNTYQFFSPEMNARVQERLTLETSLRYALERDELFLLYQPQLDLRSGRLIGMEALLRWNHPELGLMTPEKFIPVAEETGLILEIGGWVLDAACRQVNLWKNMGYSSLRLAVNISGRQFNHPCFIDMVDLVLENTGFDPGQLELELTESTIMENAEVTIMTLTDIKVRGLNLAIDDFGTGYSSLSYLKHFPFDRLKIAQSFVHDVTADPDNAAIVDAVIAVAHSLNIKVIAEGVETREQLEFLHERHCDELQGYYFGRPLTPEKFQQLLEAGFSLKDICPFDPKTQAPELL